MIMATKTRKGPKYLIGKFRPAAGIVNDEPNNEKDNV